MGLEALGRQEFDELVVHTPHGDLALRAALDLLDLRLPRALRAALGAVRRRVRDRQGQRAAAATTVHTDRGDVSRAAGRRRARLAADPRLRRRLPAARRAALARARGPSRRRLATTSRSGSTAATSRPATAGASRRATSSGSASAPSTRASTSRTRPCCSPTTSSRRRSATRATGSPTSCARRPRTASSSSATPPGHCLPLTAEGIRTAFYFGIALGRRAAGRGRGRAGPRGRRCATTASSRRARVEVPLDAAGPAAAPQAPGPRAARRDPRPAGASASSTGPSTTTCGSRRRTSPRLAAARARARSERPTAARRRAAAEAV